MSKKRKITIRMPKADLEKVLAALRLPENQDKQGRGALFNGTGYCCLGVMQQVCGGAVEAYRFPKIDKGPRSFLGFPSREWLNSRGWTFLSSTGTETSDPYLPSVKRSASHLNDGGQYTFAQIADIIERHAEGY